LNTPPLLAQDVLEEFVREGVTHVVGVPDNDTAPLFGLLASHSTVRLVRVAREGEAFAMAAGLWLGGAKAVVVIQNTGLLESGDALRGTASRMGVPLVVLVGYRGFAKMIASGRSPEIGPPTPEELVQPGIDSVALMTEPSLVAWGVPAVRVGDAADRGQIRRAFARSVDEQRVVALLLTRTLG
jgi:thiamine pyrophosphate-dependent acetolactate synthase large subunit-like protein